MHSHEDAEDFYILAGSQEVLTQQPEGLEWAHAHAGDYVRVPPGTMHAHRNVSAQPAVDLIITTAKLGRFFQEVGEPVTGQPPSPERVAKFVETAIRYGYTLGTPSRTPPLASNCLSSPADIRRRRRVAGLPSAARRAFARKAADRRPGARRVSRWRG